MFEPMVYISQKPLDVETTVHIRCNNFDAATMLASPRIKKNNKFFLGQSIGKCIIPVVY